MQNFHVRRIVLNFSLGVEIIWILRTFPKQKPEKKFPFLSRNFPTKTKIRKNFKKFSLKNYPLIGYFSCLFITYQVRMKKKRGHCVFQNFFWGFPNFQSLKFQILFLPKILLIAQILNRVCSVLPLRKTLKIHEEIFYSGFGF